MAAAKKHKRSLLWVGDAVVASGFARCTHRILKTLCKSWDVSVLGINYTGDPHNYPYPIYPCYRASDIFGLNRVGDLVSKLKPDVVVLQNDPWNIPEYLKRVGNVPAVGFLAVDGKNCRGAGMNGLRCAIFWTQFAQDEAAKGGYRGYSSVVPLGVDLDIYKPMDKKEARKKLGLPDRVHDAWIVGNVNRNQPRKRFDLVISIFAQWVQEYDVRDAYLYLHAGPTRDTGYDIVQLMKYYGVAHRLIHMEPEMWFGISEKGLATTYSSFDVQFTCTQGEGWGLPAMEGMACGTPLIAPDWSALGEWARPAACLVPCSEIACTPSAINVIGGIIDRRKAVNALNRLYKDRKLYQEHREAGFELAAQPQYRWDNIGKLFDKVLTQTLEVQSLPSVGTKEAISA
jgi:D-inositol-3-phosphate glycosyltransferase